MGPKNEHQRTESLFKVLPWAFMALTVLLVILMLTKAIPSPYSAVCAALSGLFCIGAFVARQTLDKLFLSAMRLKSTIPHHLAEPVALEEAERYLNRQGFTISRRDDGFAATLVTPGALPEDPPSAYRFFFYGTAETLAVLEEKSSAALQAQLAALGYKSSGGKNSAGGPLAARWQNTYCFWGETIPADVAKKIRRGLDQGMAPGGRAGRTQNFHMALQPESGTLHYADAVSQYAGTGTLGWGRSLRWLRGIFGHGL